MNGNECLLLVNGGQKRESRSGIYSMKMRLEKIALLSLVVLPSHIQSLVSCSLQVSRHQFSRSQFVLFQLSDDPSSDWGDEATEDDEVIDVTNYLVSPSIEPGSLSAEEMADFFPLMLWWADGTMHSHENAATIEKLLNRFEKEIEAGKPAPKALVKYYVVAVDAWGKAGFPDKAKEIISRMEALDLVNRVAYNAMMNAYVKLGDTENAAKILDMMEKTPSLAPTVLDYNTLLAGYAKRGHARQAEDLVKRMIDMCRGEDKRGLTPDLYSYNTLLDALAKSDEPGRGDRAHGILTTLLRKHEVGELEWAPDERSFSAVISALAREGRSLEKIEKLWSEALVRGFGSDKYIHTALLDAIAKSDLSGSAEKASEILEKLEHEGLASDVAYNTVLKACKAEGTDKALQQAEKLFEKMSTSGAADRFSYCTLIAMHADRGNIKSAERAEKLLVEMGNAMLVPNVETLNAVMNAWTKCGLVNRAERILKDMEESYYSRRAGDRIAPNVVSYTTIMNGWAKSGNRQAVEKTNETFQRMKAMRKSGNTDAQPNLFSYVTMIGSITQAKQPGSAEKAEQALYSMYEEYKSGVIAMPPNARLVTAVIDSWQKSGATDAGERAETLLNWLLEVYQEEQDESMEPNEYTFNSVISAWARTRKFGKSARARAILTRMQELSESGMIRATPNVHCYTAVINSCAYCGNDSMEQRQALRIAIETYKEMLEAGRDGPNHITFSTLLTALRNLMPPDDTRALAIETVFKRCASDGYVTDDVLRRLMSSLTMDQLHKLIGRTVIRADGSIDISAIPAEWTRQSNRSTSKSGNAQIA